MQILCELEVLSVLSVSIQIQQNLKEREVSGLMS